MATTGGAAGFFGITGITAPSAYAETLADSLGLNKLASNWSALGTTAPAAGPAGEASGEADGPGDAASGDVQKQLKQLTCVRAVRCMHAPRRALPTCSQRRASTRWDA